MHLQMFNSFYFLVEKKPLEADSRGFMTIFFYFDGLCNSIN